MKTYSSLHNKNKKPLPHKYTIKNKKRNTYKLVYATSKFTNSNYKHTVIIHSTLLKIGYMTLNTFYYIDFTLIFSVC